MTTPVLKTNRLILSPPLIHDQMNVDHYLKWLCNERVTQFSEQRHKTHTIKSQREYLKSFGGDDQIWEIKRNSTPIGSITSYRNLPNSISTLGIMMGETQVWGQGYASEAWDAVCRYLFEDGIRKIDAGCMASNTAMSSVLVKCGFIYEATLPNFFLLNGKPEDMKYYGKYREAKIIPIQSASK